MQRSGLGIVTTIGALAIAVAVLVTPSPQDLTLVRRPLDEGSLTLSARARSVAVPLPTPFDPSRTGPYDEIPRIVLSSSGDEVRAWLEQGGLLASVFRSFSCVIRDLTATCGPHDVLSFCGTGPTLGALASEDPERYQRFDLWGGGASFLRDRTLELELEIPDGPGDAMALEGDVLLRVHEHQLLAYRLQPGWVGPLGRPLHFGATGHQGAFERCDFGSGVALYGASGEVIVRRGSEWSHYETRDARTEGPGVWTCTSDALLRVERTEDDAALEVISCTSAGCARARRDLPPELQNARTVDAVHLGSSIAVLFADARDELRYTTLGTDGFSPTMPVARQAALSRGRRGRVVLLASGGRLFAGILTLAGPAILVIDADGTPAWVRSEAPPEAAHFGAASTFPDDAEIELVDSAFEDHFRLTWRTPTRGEHRACRNDGSPWAPSILRCDDVAPDLGTSDAVENEVPLTAVPAELAAVAGSATDFTSCPLVGELAWIASRRVGEDAVPVALAIGTSGNWTVHELDPVSATVGCFGDAVSVLSVDGDRVRRRRCDRLGCNEVVAPIPTASGAIAIDLGDRVALLEPSAGGALIARVGTVESLADTAPIEVVDAASAFVPLGTGAVAERTGVALLVGRTAAGIGVLRVGSDERAVAVRRPWHGFELGEMERVAP